MGDSIQRRISALLLSNRKHARYLAVLACMAVAVVFGVSMVLRQQGQAATHEETVLDCQYSGDGAHTHDASCYDADGNLVCPLEEKPLHVHDESCWASETHLACGMEEGEGAHTHDESCWATETRTICGLEEGEGAHTHTEECYDEDGEVICGLDESEGHVHTDECYVTEDVLVCGQEESEGHVHTNECYVTEDVLICGLEETTEEHVHGDGCFKTVVVEDEPAATDDAAADDSVPMPAQRFNEELKETDEDGNEKVVLTVVAEAPEGALPEGTTMEIRSVDPSSIRDKVDVAIAEKTEDEATKIQAVGITFKDKDGKEVESAKVVTVTLASDLIATIEEPLLVHVDKLGEAKVVDTLDEAALKARDITTEDDELLFDSKEAGTYAVVATAAELATDAATITATASDGATVTIEGDLPEGAVASIEPVELSRDELVAFYGEDLVDAVDSMVVYDICILVDGEEWEPGEGVTVTIQSPAIETKESSEEIAVTHLQEEGDKKVVERLETEVTEGGDVAFRTDGFSLYGLYTYTVDYYLNDNEYHQPGNTSMMLSELFEHLLVEIPTSEVESVEFTDYTLLQIDQEGDDFKITSLKPFTTDEMMTVHFKDGSFLTIITKDLIYASYTYDDSALTPYTGSFNYVGHYNIFGGGNGVPSVAIDDPLPNNWWAGQYGGNSSWTSTLTPSDGGVTVTLPSLQGKAIGNDQNGQPLEAESGKFKSGSSAVITWEGNLERAFFSFSWLYYYGTSAPTTAIFDVKLYAPGGDFTTVVLNTGSETNDPRDPDPIVGNNTTSAWRMLSFEATDFVSDHGMGTYTVVVTIEPIPGKTTIGSTLSDMGFTIYGVTADADQPMSAIAGVVDEVMISAKSTSSSLPDRSAEVTLEEPISPRGNGKAWFNCQGGEYITLQSDGHEHDRDYLELKKEDGTYLKLGTGGDIEIPGWNYEDIACPNQNQTPPAGCTAFQNRCSFGLASFTGLQNAGEIVGLRKSMERGNDCFGSLMLLVEIMPAEGTVEVTKKLEYDGNGVNDVLPDSGVNRTLTFHVEPTGGAPVPTKMEGGVEVPNQDFSINFPANTHSGDEVLFEMGTFKFNGNNIPGSATSSGPWYLTYEVTETSSTDMYPWTYDTRTLLLTFKVKVDEESSEFVIDGDPTWAVKDHPEDPINYFKNGYKLPTEMAVEKVNVEGEHLEGAKFMLYKDADCTQVADVFIDEECETALTTSNAPATGSDGLAHFYGIDKENSPYYLKETYVPSPYILDDTVITITYIESDDGGYWVYQEDEAEEPTLMTTSVSDTTDLGTISLVRVNERAHDIYVQKTDDAGTRIAGSKFQLYQYDEDQQQYVAYGDEFVVPVDGDGFKVENLQPGKYLLEETKAPEAYVVITADTYFEVNDVTDTTSSVITLTDGPNGEKQQYASLDTTDQTNDTIVVMNVPGQTLPKTGGPGTTLFTIVGSAACVAAVVMHGFASRRGRERRFE